MSKHNGKNFRLCREGDPTMIVYSILNQLDGKRYIGQSLNCFRVRYGMGSDSWWKYIDNKHLKNAIAKYGHDNFKVDILESNVPSIEELDIREAYWIGKYNTVIPNGYNYVSGGQQIRTLWFTNEQRDALALKKSNGKIDKFLNNRTGEIFTVVNIKRFADERGLSHVSLHRVARGSKTFHKEWSLPTRPMKKMKLSNLDTGDTHIILQGEMAAFCKLNRINQANLYNVLDNKANHANGWHIEIICPDIASPNTTFSGNGRTRCSEPLLISPEQNTSMAKLGEVMDAYYGTATTPPATLDKVMETTRGALGKQPDTIKLVDFDLFWGIGKTWGKPELIGKPIVVVSDTAHDPRGRGRVNKGRVGILEKVSPVTCAWAYYVTATDGLDDFCVGSFSDLSFNLPSHDR